MTGSLVVAWLVPAILLVRVVLASWFGVRWAFSEQLETRSIRAGGAEQPPTEISGHRLVGGSAFQTMAPPQNGRELKAP